MPRISPMVLKPEYYDPIEAEIQRIFDELLYIPLTRVLTCKQTGEVMNAISAILAAVQSGRIWYEDGHFKGTFNARISKELLELGAKYNPPSNTWTLPIDQVPTDVRFAQAAADDKITKMRTEMLNILDGIKTDDITKISTAPEQYEKSLAEMNAAFVRAAAAIAIPPQFTPAMREQIAYQYGQNLDLYIQKWTDENILKLREQVQQHAYAGGRADGLVKILQESYGQSKNKAKFLARQETALAMSSFQESRYADIGITEYTWSTSNDERVRHDHKILHGKVFSFSSPPVTNRQTGARNNPGQDYNCRCVAVPLVR